MARPVKPDLLWRPVFVQYVAVRKCRYNPSYRRFGKLPKLDQQFVWGRWEKRHKDVDLKVALVVSEPPTKKRVE